MKLHCRTLTASGVGKTKSRRTASWAAGATVCTTRAAKYGVRTATEHAHAGSVDALVPLHKSQVERYCSVKHLHENYAKSVLLQLQKKL